MKKAFIFLLLFIGIPVYLNALSYTNYNDSIPNTNNYINKYSDRNKYLKFGDIYDFDSSGIKSNSSFYSGGLLSKLEYERSLLNDRSYLANGRRYWLITSVPSSDNQYYIDARLLRCNKDSENGIRVTQFVNPPVKVDGVGTYVNPWVFRKEFIVRVKPDSTAHGSVSPEVQMVAQGKTSQPILITETEGYMYSSSDCGLSKIRNVSNFKQEFEIKNVSSDTECIVNFKLREINIKYECGSGYGTNQFQTVRYGEEYTLKTGICNKAGYTQSNWTTTAGDIYSLGETGTWNSTNGQRGVSSNTLTLRPVWTINNPEKPTISPTSATKVYGDGSVELACNTTTNYASDTTKHYSFGYASNNSTNPSDWVASTNNKYNTSGFRGTRYYSCNVYATNNTLTSSTVTSDISSSSEITFVNARINFDANGGTLSGSTPQYVSKNVTNIYSGRTNTSTGTIPTATKTGYTFDGWYTDASGGTKVIAADKTVQANVSGWTDANKKWQLVNPSNDTSVNKLYAHYSANALNFSQGNVTTTYSVTNVTQTISGASNGTGSYTYTITDGNINNYFSISGTTLTVKAKTPANTAGYTIKVKAKDNNSGSEKEISFKVIINKANQTVALSAKTDAQRTYIASAIASNTATVTLLSGDTFNGTITYTYYTNSGCSSGATTTAPTAAGTYYVKATTTALSNYNAGSSSCVNHTIIKSNTTVALSAISKTYTGSSQAASGASAKLSSNSSTISSPTITYNYYSGTGCSGTALSGAPTNAGTYSVKATLTGTTNYNTSNVCATYTMNRATVAFPSCTSKTYTAASQTLFAAHTSGKYTNSAITGTNVNSYTGDLTPTSNYQWSSGSNVTSARTLTCSITKSNTTTTLSAITKTYTGSAQAASGASATLSSNSSTISGAAFTYKYYTNNTCTSGETSTAPTAVGTYYVKATLTGTTNYNTSTSGCVKYTMNKAASTITCSNKTYTGSQQTACSCSGGTIGGNYRATNVGTYEASCTGDSNHSNATNKSWTMSKSNTTTTLSAITKTYTGSAQAASGATAKLSSNSNTISGAAFTYKYYTNSSCSSGQTSTAPTAAGTYYVKATLTGTTNYNTSTSGCVKYTMNKAAPTFTCSDKNYTGSTVTGCTSSGCSLGGTYQAKDPGTYTASCTGDSNHTTPSNKTWKINATYITVTYENAGGTGCSSEQKIKNGTFGGLCTPTLANYDFKGWYIYNDTYYKDTYADLAANGVNTQALRLNHYINNGAKEVGRYCNSGGITSTTNVGSSNITIYAKWLPKTQTVYVCNQSGIWARLGAGNNAAKYCVVNKTNYTPAVNKVGTLAESGRPDLIWYQVTGIACQENPVNQSSGPYYIYSGCLRSSAASATSCGNCYETGFF